MKYSIIIPYHSNRNFLNACLQTLKPTVSDETEIIIVANNSNLEELDIKTFDRCRVLKYKKSMYYPRAVNIGVQEAHGEYVVLMDADICVRTGWLEALSSVFAIYPNVGGCSAKMLDPFDGRVKEYGIGFTGYNFPHPFKGRKETDIIMQCNREVQAFCSATSMFRRDEYLQLGGMDEYLIDGYSDIDLCIRLHAQGLHTYVASDAVVYHHGSSTHGSGMSDNLRADTKGYFMSHNGKHCVVDMDQYYKLAFQTSRISLETHYFLVDFTTIGNYQWHYDLFSRFGHLSFADSVRFPSDRRDATHIPLYTRLDDNIRRYPMPICYFVDDFRALWNNRIWGELRSCAKDIVIDRNANIFLFTELE